MNNQPNKFTFLAAVGLALLFLIPYEYYWGDIMQWPKGYDLENLDIWADQRSHVSKLDSNDVIILGSSRAHFDINIHLWDSITGTKPLQLAYPGSSPYLPVEDIVRNTNFKGLVVVGVSPGLFFTTRNSWGSNRGKAFLDQYYERTYAEILNQRIYYHIDPYFSFLQQELSLKNLLERNIFPDRDFVEHPPIWPPMVTMSKDRNIRMIKAMEQDSLIQQRQKDIWFNPNPKNRSADSIDAILHHYVSLAKDIKERGGTVVFIRPPIDGFYVDTESKLYPS